MTFIDQRPVRGTVTSVSTLSPTFRRVTLSGPQLEQLAVEGPFYDQRIKIILPASTGELPEIPDHAQWYQAWLELDQQLRGVMRTYSIRALERTDAGTFLTIDFVLHIDDAGTSGPAATWAARVVRGDELLVVAPRIGTPAVGIEFSPGEAERIVLLGDETATPAIGRILDDLADAAHPAAVHAYLEVPDVADEQSFNGPADADVRWLPRGAAPLGQPLIEALGWHVRDDEEPASEELLWETPDFSASGEALSATSAPQTGTYYWIAGESGVIKRLRRFLVQEAGVPRSHVAFMGYWRHGVAMRG